MCSVEQIVISLKHALSDLNETDFDLPSSMLPSDGSSDSVNNSGSIQDIATITDSTKELQHLEEKEETRESDAAITEKQIKEEITEDVDDVIMEEAAVTTGAFEACSTDSSDPDNVEVCIQSSSSTDVISDTQKLSPSNFVMKRQISKEKKLPPVNKNNQSSAISVKVPIQYRRCYVCALSCHFGSVECCTFCDNVYHKFCVEGISDRVQFCCGSPGCKPSAEEVIPSLSAISTKLLSTPTASDLKATDSFCTSFMSKDQWLDNQFFLAYNARPPINLWPEWRLKRSFHNGNRTHVLVPKAVKEAYRNAGIEKKPLKPHTYDLANSNLRQTALSLLEKLPSSDDAQPSPDNKLLSGRPEVDTTLNDACSANGPIYLLLVDESLENILEKKELVFNKGFVSIGTDASKCDVEFSGMKQCKLCSPLHCRIFYNSIEKRFELLNYCHAGTFVDDVLYCLNKANYNALFPSQSSRSQSLPIQSDKASPCLCHRQDAADVNHNISVAWEGSAVLTHGSRIIIGCTNLVFATV